MECFDESDPYTSLKFSDVILKIDVGEYKKGKQFSLAYVDMMEGTLSLLEDDAEPYVVNVRVHVETN